MTSIVSSTDLAEPKILGCKLNSVHHATYRIEAEKMHITYLIEINYKLQWANPKYLTPR